MDAYEKRHIFPQQGSRRQSRRISYKTMRRIRKTKRERKKKRE
jgi:hypothetical protein